MRALALVLALATQPRVEIRGGTVWLDGQRAWRGVVTSPLVWSARGDALAFAGRDPAGRPRLVVVLDGPTVMIWPLGQVARAVVWLGPNRVGAGPSALEPRAVASFSVTR
jgi:hypothetical protein